MTNIANLGSMWCNIEDPVHLRQTTMSPAVLVLRTSVYKITMCVMTSLKDQEEIPLHFNASQELGGKSLMLYPLRWWKHGCVCVAVCVCWSRSHGITTDSDDHRWQTDSGGII